MVSYSFTCTWGVLLSPPTPTLNRSKVYMHTWNWNPYDMIHLIILIINKTKKYEIICIPYKILILFSWNIRWFHVGNSWPNS